MMNETEIWKDIEGYENLYQVSNLGNVRSLRHTKPHLITQTKNRNGYLQVALSICSNKLKKFYVHRLVAQAFIPNPNNLPQVNHKDENKLNNRAENLDWCTPKFNINYGTSLERRAKAQTNRKDLSKPVLQFDKNGNFINEYQSMSDATRKTGIHFSHISKVCKGKVNYNSAGGFIWKYKN